ncbi:MAG: hypothetical protein IKM88_00355 [Lachnospiraceae bacterium]|nr:hypothetical protein [Lachnospiraceae bacterium]MBR6848673.1 hypothetical protein [Lachnospiraceae bacterium]
MEKERKLRPIEECPYGLHVLVRFKNICPSYYVCYKTIGYFSKKDVFKEADVDGDASWPVEEAIGWIPLNDLDAIFGIDTSKEQENDKEVERE